MTDKIQVGEFMKRVSEKGMVMTLEPVREMCRLLGNPQSRIPCVHIAGTNGKGSVLSMISSCLKEAGVRVGTFFSPQVFDDEPSIAVNGAPVDEELYLSVMEGIMAVYAEMETAGIETPTVFEIETVCALMCFERSGCDISVVECGMGGVNDATNIIDSNIVCVFTPIALDHTDFLGETIAEIAENKAGIIRQGCTVVCAEQEAMEAMGAISWKAREAGCPLVYCGSPENIIAFGLDGQSFEYKREDYNIKLLGSHQCRNAAAAIEALFALRDKGFRISDNAVKSGLEKAVWHGRFECISREPLVILDGAHNVQGAKALAEAMEQCLIGKKITLVFGILADKQYREAAEILASKADRIVTFTPPNPRALDGEKLREICEKFAPTVTAKSAEEAMKLALSDADSTTAVCAAGSLYSLNEIKKSFGAVKSPEKSVLDLANKIVKNLVFIMKMADIRRLERDRIFCGHDISHCMDVARLTMLICAEEGIEADADMVYSAALLHDIGRSEEYVSGIPHDTAGIEIAARILMQIECSPETSREIIRLIASHSRSSGKKTPLEDAFYRADKQSRLCFACPARDECCWDDSRKNLKIRR